MALTLFQSQHQVHEAPSLSSTKDSARRRNLSSQLCCVRRWNLRGQAHLVLSMRLPPCFRMTWAWTTYSGTSFRALEVQTLIGANPLCPHASVRPQLFLHSQPSGEHLCHLEACSTASLRTGSRYLARSVQACSIHDRGLRTLCSAVRTPSECPRPTRTALDRPKPPQAAPQAAPDRPMPPPRALSAARSLMLALKQSQSHLNKSQSHMHREAGGGCPTALWGPLALPHLSQEECFRRMRPAPDRPRSTRLRRGSQPTRSPHQCSLPSVTGLAVQLCSTAASHTAAFAVRRSQAHGPGGLPPSQMQHSQHSQLGSQTCTAFDPSE